MRRRRIFARGIIAGCAMLVLILDTRTAISSAREGIELCTRTIIPSLFPFFVLSGVINSCLVGQNLPFFRPLGRLCKIPKGAESLLILGFLAGYPVGAQLITQANEEGKLPTKTARRMLGFCSNAGPAFLFGIVSPLFSNGRTVWILWGVHILSALITGCILPASPTETMQVSSGSSITLQESLQKALKASASVCGWVILFRVVIGFCNRWFFWLIPTEVHILASGFLELANGCVLLQNISRDGIRFLLAGTMLSFGGLCVGMQTMSVTTGLGTGWYFPGKVLQTAVSALICILLQPVLFSKVEAVTLPPSAFVGLVAGTLLLVIALRKKSCGILKEIVV